MAARASRPRRLAPGLDGNRCAPGGPGMDDGHTGAPNPLTLRVLVQGANGAVTEIDRRNLVFVP